MINKNVVRFLLISFVCILSLVAEAAKKPKKKAQQMINRTETCLVLDVDSGKILHQMNAHEQIYPASLTKLMTLYVVFNELKQGKLSLDDNLYISKKAIDIPPGNLGLKPGETINTKDAILSVIIKSANDSSNVLAEHIGGTQQGFVDIMNDTAHKLGLKNSHFTNAHGWHNPNQKSTATDLAKLSLKIRNDFPQYYHWFGKDIFEYKGRIIRGHNRVTREYAWAQGMKTGFTNPAGFNLVSSASKNGKNLIAVVTGSPSARVRDTKMIALLDKHFDSFTQLANAKSSSKSQSSYQSDSPLESKNINSTKISSANTYKKNYDVFELENSKLSKLENHIENQQNTLANQPERTKDKSINSGVVKQKSALNSKKAKKFAINHKKQKKLIKKNNHKSSKSKCQDNSA